LNFGIVSDFEIGISDLNHNLFLVSVIGFECFGLFRISSFGNRIFILCGSFGFAQDRLGSKNFVEVVLLNILLIRI